jgi:hypothetical protein
MLLIFKNGKKTKEEGKQYRGKAKNKTFLSSTAAGAVICLGYRHLAIIEYAHKVSDRPYF